MPFIFGLMLLLSVPTTVLAQTQLPKTPQPDDVSQHIHIEPENLSLWLQQEFQDLGEDLEVVKRRRNRKFDLQYNYRWTRKLGSKENSREERLVHLNFQNCKDDPDVGRKVCEIAKFQIALREHAFCDEDLLFPNWGPRPLGFRVQEVRRFCEVEIGSTMVAEGPLFLIENIEWLIEVAALLSNPPKPVNRLLKGQFRNQTGKDVKERWRQLEDYSTLHIDDLPWLGELVSLDPANEQFELALDRFAHYRQDPLVDNYEGEVFGHVVFSDRHFSSWITPCGSQRCTDVVFGSWPPLFSNKSFLADPKFSFFRIIHEADASAVWLPFISPSRGMSPSLLKALMRIHVDFIDLVSPEDPYADLVSASAGAVITPANVAGGYLYCWDEAQQVPQVGFLRNKYGDWIEASEGCTDLKLSSRDLTEGQSTHVLRHYLKALDGIFKSPEWEGIAAIIFIKDPALQYVGLYSPPYDNEIQHLIFNLDDVSGELEDGFFFSTLVHEFAHHLYYSAISSSSEDGSEVTYHPCVEAPAPDTCRDFDGPVAGYLKKFWWEHADGFTFLDDEDEGYYSGLYRIIDDSGAFVSEYAATDAWEDFAESFTAAVFDDYSLFNRDGQVAADKLAFFQSESSHYSGLVSQIRNGFYETFSIFNTEELYTNLGMTNRLIREAKSQVVEEIEVDEKYEETLELAEGGNPEAQLRLAKLYLKGNGESLNRDPTWAFYWLEKASEHPLPEAHYEMGMRYLLGDSVEKDIPASLKWVCSAAELGSVQAYRDLPELFHYMYELYPFAEAGWVTDEDLETGEIWQRFADGLEWNGMDGCEFAAKIDKYEVQDGFVDDQPFLENDLRGDANASKINLTYEQALELAEAGDAEAQLQLARHLMDLDVSDEMDPDSSDGLYYDPDATLDVGQAVYWLEQAADSGLAEAHFVLGVQYLLGEFIEQNIVEAVKRLCTARDLSFHEAETALPEAFGYTSLLLEAVGNGTTNGEYFFLEILEQFQLGLRWGGLDGCEFFRRYEDDSTFASYVDEQAELGWRSPSLQERLVLEEYQGNWLHKPSALVDLLRGVCLPWLNGDTGWVMRFYPCRRDDIENCEISLPDNTGHGDNWFYADAEPVPGMNAIVFDVWQVNDAFIDPTYEKPFQTDRRAMFLASQSDIFFWGSLSEPAKLIPCEQVTSFY